MNIIIFVSFLFVALKEAAIVLTELKIVIALV